MAKGVTLHELDTRRTAKAPGISNEERLLALAESPDPIPGTPTDVDQEPVAPPVTGTKTKQRKEKVVEQSNTVDSTLDRYKSKTVLIAFVLDGIGNVTVPAVSVEEGATTLCVVFDTSKPSSFFVPTVGATLQMYAGDVPYVVYYPGALVTIEALGITVMTFIKVPDITS